MKTSLVISLIFAAHSHAKISAFSSNAAAISAPTTPQSTSEATTTPIAFDVEAELEKMSASCLTSGDHERLWRNTIKHTLARVYNRILIKAAVEMIGQTEMRAALDFSPRRSWAPSNYTKPSENELASALAVSMEAYFDLKEPRTKLCSLDSLFLLEKNVSPAIEFLDERFHFIRAQYKRSFEEIRRRNADVVDREVIDSVIGEFLTFLNRIGDAVSSIFEKDDEYGCLE